MPHAPDVVPLSGWDAGSQEALAIAVVAGDLGVDEAFVRSRVEMLRALVPALGSKIHNIKVA